MLRKTREQRRNARYQTVVVTDNLWPTLKRAGLRRVTMHSLRHSFASVLLMSGRPITEVQHLLGHSSPSMTLRVYAHLLPSDQTLGTDALANVILGPLRDGQGGAAVEKWALTGGGERHESRSG